ncbi:hypothetical protein EYR36_007049 [Pleurotus pulmonarius]|nr:hypothetical protein EYR36_007049 [Pleurotus pulmonarius]
MKLNSPLPQPLPKECEKAAKIFKSFVDSGNNGLDGVIPRHILENAKGFAIFTIFKAGFLFSARAGSGIVIAKLDDGTWSAPSAIGTAGVGVGGQAGAEVTDFLVVLNSRSASFMAAGSLTLGGNMSIALGPLGRNGEASGSLNTKGKVAAMYSYSKTRGLFGGVSVEGSVIVERQDANAQAYGSSVTAKQLLSGSIDPPQWANNLVKTLEACTGLPGNRKWVDEGNTSRGDNGYAFGAMGSPSIGSRSPSILSKKKPSKPTFPPTSWGSTKDEGSYFSSEFEHTSPTSSQQKASDPFAESPVANPTARFETRFDSDYTVDVKNPISSPSFSPTLKTHSRSFSHVPPPSGPFFPSSNSGDDYGEDEQDAFSTTSPKPYIQPKPELMRPLLPGEGVARAIALYDFNAVESGDLSFAKGDIIIVTKKSDSSDDWWTGKAGGKQGIFPANFVELA